MKTLKNLTAADWQHIRETCEMQFECVGPDDTELPEEVIMTSIGYVTVGLLEVDRAGHGFVSAFGETLEYDEWPEIIPRSEAIHRCQWDIYTKMDLTVDFLQERGLYAAWRKYLLECAIEELGGDGDYIVEEE